MTAIGRNLFDTFLVTMGHVAVRLALPFIQCKKFSLKFYPTTTSIYSTNIQNNGENVKLREILRQWLELAF